jgi:SAM-dependent methyltransferase
VTKPGSSSSRAIRRITSQNRRAWDEIAEVRYQNQAQPPDFFARGGSVLDGRVVEAAGEVAGKTLLHLQCATGEDTLSWAVLGAQATGVDLSPRQVELAQQAAAQAGLPVRFVAADVYDLPPDLQDASFDIVYTGGGAVVWLPDLSRWAETVIRALRAGGRLILHEIHPISACLAFNRDRLEVSDDYFRRALPYEGAGWFHFPGGEDAKENKYEFSWPLGDVVTALAQAGLRIESLAEYPNQARWQFGEHLDEVQKLPGEYLLIASKPG